MTLHDDPEFREDVQVLGVTLQLEGGDRDAMNAFLARWKAQGHGIWDILSAIAYVKYPDGLPKVVERP